MAREMKIHTAEGFAGSIFKYSISTFVNVGVLGLSVLLTGRFIAPEVNNQIGLFLSWTQTIMTVAVLGLDQAFMRFYASPPARLKDGGLFRLCFYFSALALLAAAAVCCGFLATPIYHALGFSMAGLGVVPLLFLNAFFYMVARYFNVLYRMEGNIALYTAESILMQFFYKLFYLLGGFLGFENPVPAMILCSVFGLGAFAVIFGCLRRGALRPRKKEFGGACREVLPYGFAAAPTAVFLVFNSSATHSLLTHTLGKDPAGVYTYAYTLSNIVSMVQLGFASFWGPYMYQHYATQQRRICKVHDILNFIVLVFFAFLVAAEEILFFILPKYAAAQPIFPLMMLSAVFTIFCETTVYGNAIAKKPVFDTVGFGIAFLINIGLCVCLAAPFGLYGAAAALAAANFAMFFFRTLTAQRLYRSIRYPLKTAAAVVLAAALAAVGSLWAHSLPLRLAACTAAAAAACLLYGGELRYLCKFALSMLKRAAGR